MKSVLYFHSRNIKQIQAGITDKMGQVLQGIAQFIFGIVVGLTSGWQLTLVTAALAPVLGVTFTFKFRKMAAYEKRVLESYGKAGAVASEVLGSIRTILAFGGVQKEATRYAENIKDAKVVGRKKSFMFGVTVGMVNAAFFLTYIIGFVASDFLLSTCVL